MTPRPPIFVKSFAFLLLSATWATADTPTVFILDGVRSPRIAGVVPCVPDLAPHVMARELARTKSFSYTHMNLRGFLHLARLGEHVDVDLWTYRSEDGRSIQAALDWLEPFVAGREKWTYRQISAYDPKSASRLYRRASYRLDEPAYRELGSITLDPVTDLLWPPP